MQPGQMAYDRAITVFSPDGRLFQFEYARVAVTRGNTTAGLKFKNGIVLMADKKIGSRLVAQINKVTYSERIGIDLLVKRICDYKQNYTQYGGVRPFGTALLVAGVDDLGIHLYETDPSGALVSYKAGSIGSGRNTVMELFEEKFRDGMAQEDATILGLEALQKASEEKLDAKTVEVGGVVEGEKFRRLGEDEVAAFLRRVPASGGEEGEAGRPPKGSR